MIRTGRARSPRSGSYFPTSSAGNPATSWLRPAVWTAPSTGRRSLTLCARVVAKHDALRMCFAVVDGG